MISFRAYEFKTYLQKKNQLISVGIILKEVAQDVVEFANSDCDG
jgi:hypothetical protein